MKIGVAGLKIDSLNKQELLTLIQRCIKEGKKLWITTPYSEFLHAGLKDPKVLEMLNKADVAVPDGIGIFWAKRFLDLPLTAKNYWLKILQAYWQALWTLAAILLHPTWIKKAFPEKIPGSELIWVLVKLAAENNLSIHLLGGFDDTPKAVADKLISLSAYQLRIAGYSNKNPEDNSVIEDIKKSNADILLVAYGPIKQEQWIAKHLNELPVKLTIGLGGTFDYIAGKKISPPAFIRKIGLEWLFRLLTQPHRIKRIWNATAVLMIYLIRYKVFWSLPYRPNAVAVILNKQNEVLICKRSPLDNTSRKFGLSVEFLTEHWQMPQGGITNGESPEHAAIREAFEEVGLKNLQVIRTSEKSSSYVWNNSQRKLLYNSPHKGQQQKIVYLRYPGSNTDVKVDQNEFVDFKWVPINKLSDELHTERLPIAKIALEDLKDLA